MTYSLRDLEAQFQRVETRTSSDQDQDGRYVWRDEKGQAYFWSAAPDRYVFRDVQTLAEADHIDFLCPACFAKNAGPVGTHHVMVSFAGRAIPDGAGTRGSDGKPSRWNVAGSGIDDLVLTPSIALSAGACGWHGFVGSNGIAPGHAG